MDPHHLLWDYTCDGSVISVAATPNCSTICAATVGRSLYLLSGDGQPLWKAPYQVDFEAWATSISEDGQYIAVGTANKSPADGSVFVFDRDQRLLWNKRVRSPVWGVSLSADGQFVAASTWSGNTLHLFRRSGSSYVDESIVRIPGDSGLYGVKLTANGELCLVASYDTGIFLVEKNGEIVSRLELEEGFYNVSLAGRTNTAFIGTRPGGFLIAQLEDEIDTRHSKTFSQRPVCGIAVTENGLLVANGSFDGRVILTNNLGEVLWQEQTKGEVWTTAISSTGRRVCAGCGDHKVRMFHNGCDTSVYQEVMALEAAVAHTSSGAAASLVTNLVELYLRYALVTYGHDKLSSLLPTHPDAHVLKNQLKEFLSQSLNSEHVPSDAPFSLAVLLANEQKFFDAIRHFQVAALDPALRSNANRRAAECFAELDLKTAATSAWRQSREQHLDDNARHILFSLARSYEDLGSWGEATRIYEMLVSWDVGFRNAWDKLQMARGFRAGATKESVGAVKDYTGATTSLLGPDAPLDVDASLDKVLAARTREVLMAPGERKRVQDVVQELLDDEIFSRGIRRDTPQLSYDMRLFLKYDYGLPEDEMKKFLEAVNCFPYIKSRMQPNRPSRSLDIGSATGRYPLLLARLGFEARGIDIEAEAIAYSKSKAAEAAWPQFAKMDARDLARSRPYAEQFDVVTCMMGTFQHIPRNDQEAVVKAAYDLLECNGILILSLWDVECPHLAYLSMYDETQKDLIRQNSLTRPQASAMLDRVGFASAHTVALCLMPQAVIYDLGIEHMRADEISIAAQADLAARALFSDRHGEMFLAIGQKAAG